MLGIELEHRIEGIVRGIILGHFPRHWRENTLTDALLKTLEEQLGAVTIHHSRFPLDISWQAYKLKPPAETNHGDIGILISRRQMDGTIVDGAGFLEAKIRNRKTGKFDAVKKGQLQNISAHSPQTKLLLYDYNPIPVLNSLICEAPHFLFDPYLVPSHSNIRFSHSGVLPLQLAQKIGVFDDRLYEFCYSFAHQFVRRYFNLYDLDFRPNSIQIVKGYPEKEGYPPFILHVRLTPAGQKPPEEKPPNPEFYSRLE